MKPIIDTHTHLYYRDRSPRLDFSQDIDQVIERAKAAGIANSLIPNIDSQSYPMMMELVSKHPTYCLPMIGLHPTNVEANWQEELSFVERILAEESADRFIAIGEIGLDYHWSVEYKEEMIKVFERQLSLALQHSLPVSVHSRDAEDDTIDILQRYDQKGLKGVVHSFGGNQRQLLKVKELLPHFMVGVNGTITYKNNPFPEFLSILPMDRIVVETDAPFLAPSPYRGKRNEPAYLTKIIAKLQEIYGEREEMIREQLFANTEEMFNLTKYLKREKL